MFRNQQTGTRKHLIRTLHFQGTSGLCRSLLVVMGLLFIQWEWIINNTAPTAGLINSSLISTKWTSFLRNLRTLFMLAEPYSWRYKPRRWNNMDKLSATLPELHASLYMNRQSEFVLNDECTLQNLVVFLPSYPANSEFRCWSRVAFLQ